MYIISKGSELCVGAKGWQYDTHDVVMINNATHMMLTLYLPLLSANSGENFILSDAKGSDVCE